MGKLDDKRAERDAEIIKSCQAGIRAVLSDPVLKFAEEILDGVAADLIQNEYGDPLGFVRSQVLKSAGSVAANIAEGVGTANLPNVRRFYLNARGSAYETVIWLRALNRKDLLTQCITLCNLIDDEIIRMTRRGDASESEGGRVVRLADESGE